MEVTMSYSFTVRAADKDQAKAAVVTKMDDVVALQPVHAADKDQAVASAHAFIDLLPDSMPGREIVVTASGYVTGTQVDIGAFEVTGVSFGVGASWAMPLPA